jgi:hypothetical protein
MRVTGTPPIVSGIVTAVAVPVYPVMVTVPSTIRVVNCARASVSPMAASIKTPKNGPKQPFQNRRGQTILKFIPRHPTTPDGTPDIG